MNARIVVMSATVCLLASAWASAQPAKEPKADSEKPAAASEMARAGAGTSKTPAKPAGPKLQMDVPEKNPGKDRDVRNCLDLPTNSEIIRCTEKK